MACTNFFSFAMINLLFLVICNKQNPSRSLKSHKPYTENTVPFYGQKNKPSGSLHKGPNDFGGTTPVSTGHPALSQTPLTPEKHATLQSRRAPRPVPQFTRQDSHTTIRLRRRESLSVPYPCVLFSSTPYLRYILSETKLKVNPQLSHILTNFFISFGHGTGCHRARHDLSYT